MDLGILGTRFARVVLSVAVLEDIVLYIALTVILGIAQAAPGQGGGETVSAGGRMLS